MTGMRRHLTLRRIFISAMTMVLSAPETHAQVDPAFDVFAKPGEMIEVSPGRRLNLRCSGKGPVTVILESGLGFPSYSWRFVQPEVARFARVCSYDRAGLGFSDPGPMPRRASRIADDLEALVDKAGLRPPFVLVGSSLGSQSVRLFAFRRPDQVQALLLVDPYVEGQYAALGEVEPSITRENAETIAAERRCVARLRAGRLSARAAERAGCIASMDPAFSLWLASVVRRQRMSAPGYEAAFSESEQLENGSEEDIRREQRTLGGLPILVLSAGQNFTSAGYSPATIARLNMIQAGLHERLAGLSSAGRVRLVAEANHVIQVSAPTIVIEQIQELATGTGVPK